MLEFAYIYWINPYCKTSFFGAVSFLEPLLKNICNYVDDTKYHDCDTDLESIIQSLELDSMTVIEHFKVIRKNIWKEN